MPSIFMSDPAGRAGQAHHGAFGPNRGTVGGAVRRRSAPAKGPRMAGPSRVPRRCPPRRSGGAERTQIRTIAR
ncbi:hypothetical protein [Lysobacter gummosus]|uniref:hypothetical protein n=1 Tax=Lysobacter gummosus TaxID=262324 RepID=UPI003641F363